jgi:hypothetical protein
MGIELRLATTKGRVERAFADGEANSSISRRLNRR